MNCLVQWGALKAFFVSLSTLMLIHLFSEKSPHFFVSSAWEFTYLNMTWNGWADTRGFKVFSKSARVCFVGSEQRGVFPWETTPLLSKFTTTGGIALWYSDAAAFRIYCDINPPRTSLLYVPADAKHMAHVHLYRTLAILQYIIIVAEQMSGDTSFICDPSYMITMDPAIMPLSI